MARTDRDWTIWGENDPYFGVLSTPKFRASQIASTKPEFMAEGEAYVDRHLAEIEAYLGKVGCKKALDFGCGVGRLAIPLARRFESVVGLDVSVGMLRESERNAAEAGLTNTTFYVSDDSLSNAPDKFDFVHTYIVLQHIPVSRGMKIIQELLERVEFDGIVSLHVNLERRTPFHLQAVYWARTRVPFANGLFNLLRGRPIAEPCMQMNEYSLRDVLEATAVAGFGTAVVRFENHGMCRTVQIFARRRADLGPTSR